MLLSEMFGVERDTDFGVEGLYGKFRVRVNNGYEFLVVSDGKGAYDTVVNGVTVCRIIDAAPSGIIHLPPPLTDEQREQLKALYTLGYKWLAKDFDYQVYAHAGSKPTKSDEEWRNDCDCFMRIHDGLPESTIKSLVSWSDPEPYDIGKALGVEE